MKKQKLALNKETIRPLQSHELTGAVGGAAPSNGGRCIKESIGCGLASIVFGGCKFPTDPTATILPPPIETSY
ncbi:MAG TPA: class I lanthipeptide [Kofleriaceae bacterium]|jgi:hypothetical protein|nr:class I lanthipeptide [Kofleriaceae bacterium]